MNYDEIADECIELQKGLGKKIVLLCQSAVEHIPNDGAQLLTAAAASAEQASRALEATIKEMAPHLHPIYKEMCKALCKEFNDAANE